MKKYQSDPEEGQPLRNDQGFIAGWIIKDKLVKHVSAHKHLLRFPHGWSIDIVFLDLAEQAGVTEVVIIDDDSGRTYKAPLSYFWTKGEYVDRGYGKQWCLTLEHWVITD